jgi:hypothetical protein
MNRSVKEFIESGLLEAYVIGSASAEEEQEVLRMKNQFPQVKEALTELETDMEELARRMSIPPPPNMWNRIEAEFNEITVRNAPLEISNRGQQQQEPENKENQYINVESESTHMRIHKNWKWVFAAVFILGKIFLGFAIYFYLENRQAQQNIQELKQQVKELRGK